MLRSSRGSYTIIDVGFTNTAKQPIVAVRLVFRETDAFGMPLQTDTIDRTGTFAPGIAIDSSGWTGANVWSGWVASTKLNAVECSVEMVRFADGTEFRAAPVHFPLGRLSLFAGQYPGYPQVIHRDRLSGQAYKVALLGYTSGHEEDDHSR